MEKFDENITKVLKYLIKFLWAYVVAISLFIFIIIFYSSSDVGFWKWDGSHQGFKYFYNVYKFPISFVGISIPIYGIILAIYRTFSLDYSIAQSDKRLQIYRHNIYMSNFFKHLEEFIKMVTAFKKKWSLEILNPEIVERINERFDDAECYRIYYCLYAKKFNSDHKILGDELNSPHEKIEDIFQHSLKYFDEAQDKNSKEKISKLFEEICFDNLISDLAMDKFDDLLYYNLDLLLHILNFSNEDLKGMNEIHKIIREKKLSKKDS